VKTREELQDENNELRAAMRLATSEPWAGVRELAVLIRAEAERSAVPDHRLGMLQAASILDGGLRDD
jgi:hypothetical protein